MSLSVPLTRDENRGGLPLRIRDSTKQLLLIQVLANAFLSPIEDSRNSQSTVGLLSVRGDFFDSCGALFRETLTDPELIT